MSRGYFLLFSVFLTIALTIVFRAATLSITYDEAYTVCAYAANGSDIFSSEAFLPNNHILHTILVWAVFQYFPWQDFMLRLPAVFAGMGCLLVVIRIGFVFFDGNRRVPLTCLLLAVFALHPLVFQFFSFARGYSLSLFFSLIGFYQFVQVLGEDDLADKKNGRRLMLSGGVFGLSVAANLTAALMNSAIIFAAILARSFVRPFRFSEIRSVLLRFCLPGMALFVAFCWPILFFVPTKNFDYAATSWFDSLLSLSSCSLGDCEVVPIENKTRIFLGLPLSEHFYCILVVLLPFLVGIFLFVCSLLYTKAILFRQNIGESIRKTQPAERAFLVLFGAILIFVVQLQLLSLIGIVAFPKDRTGVLPVAYCCLFPVFLLNISYCIPIKAVRFVRMGVLFLTLAMIVQFLCLFAFPYYQNLWFADTMIRPVMRDIDRRYKDFEYPVDLVFAPINELPVQYYVEKYDMRQLRLLRIIRPGDLQTIRTKTDSKHLFFILPGDAESSLQGQFPEHKVLRREPYTNLFFSEANLSGSTE